MLVYKFDKDKHVHTLDGKRLHGVTTILSKWGDPGPLINWAANAAVDAILSGVPPEEARTAHIKKRDKAGDRGTQVHEMLELAMQEWIETGDVLYEEKDKIVIKVIDWMKEQGLVPYQSEVNLYSQELWAGGICDLIAVKDNKKYIIDFKTSNSVQTKMLFQCGAYSLMYKEMTGEKIDGCCIIHIPKGTRIANCYFRYDVTELEDAFRSILSVYKTDKEVSKLLTY